MENFMLTANLSPSGSGGRFPLSDGLSQLSVSEAAQANRTSTLVRETIGLVEHLAHAASGTASITQPEAQVTIWRCFSNLRKIKDEAHPTSFPDEFEKLVRSLDGLREDLKQRWYPKELGASLPDCVAQLGKDREVLLQDLPQDRKAALNELGGPSPIETLVREDVALGRKFTDEDIYGLVNHSYFEGRKVTDAERKLVRELSDALPLELESSRARIDKWHAALEEMQVLGWKIAGKDSEMQALPVDFKGSVAATIEILGKSDAAKFLEQRVGLQQRIDELKHEQETLQANEHPGLLAPFQQWVVKQQLEQATARAQKPPSSWAQR
jgi:hypothetical protein